MPTSVPGWMRLRQGRLCEEESQHKVAGMSWECRRGESDVSSVLSRRCSNFSQPRDEGACSPRLPACTTCWTVATLRLADDVCPQTATIAERRRTAACSLGGCMEGQRSRRGEECPMCARAVRVTTLPLGIGLACPPSTQRRSVAVFGRVLRTRTVTQPRAVRTQLSRHVATANLPCRASP